MKNSCSNHVQILILEWFRLRRWHVIMWHGVILVKIIECSHSHSEHVNPQQKASSLSSIIHWFLVLYNILLVAVDLLENIFYHTGKFLHRIRKFDTKWNLFLNLEYWRYINQSCILYIRIIHFGKNHHKNKY